MKAISLIFLGLVLLAGCKAKEKATTDMKSDAQNGVTVATDQEKQERPDRATGEHPMGEEPVPLDLEKWYADVPEGLVFGLERTPCYGQCPTYQLRIYSDLSVTYVGRMHVEKEGFYTGTITQEALEQLKAKAMEIGYFDMEHHYNGSITDIPSTFSMAQFGGMKKKIMNRYKGPQNLIDFEKMLDDFANAIEWTPGKDTED